MCIPHLQQASYYISLWQGNYIYAIISIGIELNHEWDEHIIMLRQIMLEVPLQCAYLKCMLDQMKPIKVAKVLGFLISFFPTVIRMGKISIFLFLLCSSSSSPFDCTSRAVSVSPLNRHHQELNVRKILYLYSFCTRSIDT